MHVEFDAKSKKSCQKTSVTESKLLIKKRQKYF